MIELAEYVAVNGFAPDLIAFVEITADQGRLNARVQCGGVQCQQAAFVVADQSNGQWIWDLGVLCFKPIEDSLNFANFITNDMAAHFEGLPVDPFAVGLVGVGDAVGSGELVTAID